MKKTIACILAFAMLLALQAGLAACRSQEETPAPSGSEEQTAPATQPAPSDTTAPTQTVPEPTDLPEESIPEVRRAPEEITVYPFTAEELDSALAVVREEMEGFASETGVLTFEVERIAYDPIMTDAHILQEMSGAPVDGWAEADYYAHRISFAVTYSATYDHEQTFMPDVEHEVIQVSLSRQSPQSSWTYKDHGVPVEEYSDRALSTGELAEILTTDGRILGGYAVNDQEYWLYVLDESTGEVRFLKEQR